MLTHCHSSNTAKSAYRSVGSSQSCSPTDTRQTRPSRRTGPSAHHNRARPLTLVKHCQVGVPVSRLNTIVLTHGHSWSVRSMYWQEVKLHPVWCRSHYRAVYPRAIQFTVACLYRYIGRRRWGLLHSSMFYHDLRVLYCNSQFRLTWTYLYWTTGHITLSRTAAVLNRCTMASYI
jgi:hypothetical protein